MSSKDYSSVSPSAKSLLMLKGYTNIPFARETAALLQGPEVFGLNFEDKDLGFWMRVMHFESRYWSIDQLLRDAGTNNILELSSGYSLRGLDLCRKNAKVHYIDTDLPDVVGVKQRMIEHLQLYADLKGLLDLRPLNAMDEQEFEQVSEKFDEQPLGIVNEGLLMYLNIDEKIQLCHSVRKALLKNGGYWITADVYVKRPAELMSKLPQSASESAFFEQHHIEENKFDSYEQAASFFREQGLEFVKEAVPDYASLSAMPHLVKLLPEEVRNSKQAPPKIQATWMLKAI
ncbi:class I SAM-dependent methyltransferase [Rurimicrobium arvi]|uniref:O-Methyltransferase involved in polyketide biosynthesis n=1 Tax=Rurimicrobium arvi TaxID=2049916 RepID=A0ABP8MMZ8_9BACT